MKRSAPPYYKQNRLKLLRAFCHAAETNSISKAAERLFLSQPSISLQIQALEREFGTKLFQRAGPGIRLTVEGESLYDLAQPLVQGIDSLHEAFNARQDRLAQGELSIAAAESTILYILPQPLKRFTEDYPGVSVRLANVAGRDAMAVLRADEVDFAVGSLLDVPPDITYRPFVSYQTALITPTDHPLAHRERVDLDDISAYGLILPPRHVGTWRIIERVFEQHNLKYKVAVEAGGWEVIKKYVELGFGISIVTEVCLTGEEPLAVIPLSRYFPDRTYGVAYRRGKFLSPQAREFIAVIDAALSAAAGSGEATATRELPQTAGHGGHESTGRQGEWRGRGRFDYATEQCERPLQLKR